MEAFLSFVFVLIGLRVAWFFATPVLWILSAYYLIIATDAYRADDPVSARSFGLFAICAAGSVVVRAVKSRPG